MGLLSLLGTMVAGGIALHDDFNKSYTTGQQYKDAVSKGKATYFGYDNKGRYAERSVETDEAVYLHFDKHGYRTLRGVHTQRVYRDISQEMLDEENAELKAKGKPFHYEYFVKWAMGKDLCKMSVDNETNIPYKISYDYCYHTYGKTIYDRESEKKIGIEFHEITKEEAKKYSKGAI